MAAFPMRIDIAIDLKYLSCAWQVGGATGMTLRLERKQQFIVIFDRLSSVAGRRNNLKQRSVRFRSRTVR